MDITMCQGLGCPIKDKCYRHTAQSNEHYQSWFVETPGHFEDRDGGEVFSCSMFWGAVAQSTYEQMREIVEGEA